MKATTHVLDQTLQRCSVCGDVIPANDDQDSLWQTGDHVAVLTSKWSLPVSYRTGRHDQNEKCSPSALSEEASMHSTSANL